MDHQTLIQLHRQLIDPQQRSANGVRARSAGGNTAADKPSALSPQAYLVDLIDFALKKISRKNEPIELEELQSSFHQPFGDLPVHGAAAEQDIAQIRICIEVLRSYLGERPLPNETVEADVLEAEKNFIEAAYRSLLLKLGTSYEELESIAGASGENRERLAQRLGIRESDLDKVFKSLSVLRNGVREDALEVTFGFANTRGTLNPSEDEPHFLIWRNLKIQALADSLFENVAEKEAWIEQQKKSAKETLAKAVQETEELVLARLRTALINASGKPARELSHLLMVNCEYDACFRTTRVSQAIVSLQQILWSLRAGLLQNSHPDWQLDGADFEEAWQWLGAYENWKAAMTVFIYPENVLDPSWRRTYSGKFQNIVKQLRKTRQLNRSRADELVSDYEGYFQDICQLTVEASCEEYTVFNGPEGPITRNVLYQFGRSKQKNLYLATYDDAQQSYWEKIPGFDALYVHRVIGTVTFKKSDEARLLYLFVMAGPRKPNLTFDNSNQTSYNYHTFQLYYTTFDLTQHEWSEAPQQLSLPLNGNTSTSTILLEQRLGENRPPVLLCQSSLTGVFQKSFTPDGDPWAENESWEQLAMASNFFSKMTIRSLIYSDGYSRLFYDYQNNGNELHLGTILKSNNQLGIYNFGKVADQFEATRIIPNLARFGSEATTWLFARVGGFLRLYEIKFSSTQYTIPKSSPITEDLGSISTHHGAAREQFDTSNQIRIGTRLCYINQSSNRAQHAFLSFLNEEGLVVGKATDILPVGLDKVGNEFFNLLPSKNGSGAGERLSITRTALESNAGLSEQIRGFLWEAYYFLPLYVAQKLQRSRQYHDAKDYFRLIYDHVYPIGERKRFYGLIAEETIESSSERADNWLLDPLNPHAIAAVRPNAYSNYTKQTIIRSLIQEADEAFTADTPSGRERARSLYSTAIDQLGNMPLITEKGGNENAGNRNVASLLNNRRDWLVNAGLGEETNGATVSPFSLSSNFLVHILSYAFTLPENPVWATLKIHSEMNLAKLNGCRNIAGEHRQSNQLSLPTDATDLLQYRSSLSARPSTVSLQPTPYRFSALIERAKHLVSLAQQMEGSFLSALEKLDAERLNLLNVENDLQLSRAGIRLQDLRLNEASNSLTLANLQKSRSSNMYHHYQTLINQGRSSLEEKAVQAQITAATLLGVATAVEGIKSVFSLGLLGNAASTAASAAQAISSMLQLEASFNRREEEWMFQRNLALRDIQIGEQQEKLAEDRVNIVDQERDMAALRADQAESVAHFLANKFTNAELYDWMSDVLEGIYSFFLQQATATAQLAAQQLAFERQEPVPSIILADYWEPPTDNLNGLPNTNEQADRRGLTGSARLLQDIYQLDQYVLQTDRRKLHLSKTISLANLSPIEFQQFRETGVLPFFTPMELFDRDYPGHYLRLIKRVRISVIALAPAVDGIKATLSSSGISRAVLPLDFSFQRIEIKRLPETIAINGMLNAMGVFEFEANDPNKLLPFESMGVENAWELQMPKSSNVSLNYDSIADVLITIDYTALHSENYKQQVLQQLDNTVSADRAYSFRQDFPDQWYDLHHPELVAHPMRVSFETFRSDFPPNVQDLKIKHIVLYFSRTDGFEEEIGEVGLAYDGRESKNLQTSDGIISSRRGQLPELIASDKVAGSWTLTLPNEGSIIEAVQSDRIDDIFLVLTYEGQIR